jgi:hypothetical protein
MRVKICQTSNAKALMAAQSAATAREAGLPGIVLIFGEAGRGKTVITANLSVRLGAVHLTALPIWTARWMLAEISRELGGKPGRCAAPMWNFIKQELAIRPRPIFLDESDCIADRKELIETLRILHDLTAVPLILIGMSDFKIKMKNRPQLERRILRTVEFKPSTLDDSRLMAAELAEVRIAEDLVEALHRKTRGSAGLFVKELASIEGFCRRRGMNKIGLAEYPMDDSTPPPVSKQRADLAAAA